jgi:hypothetical protein
MVNQESRNGNGNGSSIVQETEAPGSSIIQPLLPQSIPTSSSSDGKPPPDWSSITLYKVELTTLGFASWCSKAAIIVPMCHALKRHMPVMHMLEM